MMEFYVKPSDVHKSKESLAFDATLTNIVLNNAVVKHACNHVDESVYIAIKDYIEEYVNPKIVEVVSSLDNHAGHSPHPSMYNNNGRFLIDTHDQAYESFLKRFIVDTYKEYGSGRVPILRKKLVRDKVTGCMVATKGILNAKDLWDIIG